MFSLQIKDVQVFKLPASPKKLVCTEGAGGCGAQLQTLRSSPFSVVGHTSSSALSL